MAFKILTWLGYSNSAFNPIIYSIFNTEFREAFKKILTSRYPPCCGYQSVRANTPTRNENFVTDYGTKTLVVRRSGSLGLSGVDPTPRSSAESVRPLREYHIWQEDGNSNNGLLDQSDVVWTPKDWYGIQTVLTQYIQKAVSVWKTLATRWIISLFSTIEGKVSGHVTLALLLIV